MQNPTTETQASGVKNPPEKRFSTGAIQATIWKNPGKSKDGQPVDYNTISIQRRYADKAGNWQSTNSLRVNDLPKAMLVLQKAYEYLVLKDSLSGDTASASSAPVSAGFGGVQDSFTQNVTEEIVM